MWCNLWWVSYSERWWFWQSVCYPRVDSWELVWKWAVLSPALSLVVRVWLQRRKAVPLREAWQFFFSLFSSDARRVVDWSIGYRRFYVLQHINGKIDSRRITEWSNAKSWQECPLIIIIPTAVFRSAARQWEKTHQLVWTVSVVLKCGRKSSAVFECRRICTFTN